MVEFTQFDSLISMMNYFNSEEVCRQAIIENRWGIGEEQDVICPYCGEHHCVTRKDGKFRRNHCKRNFSCKVGTIFEDTNCGTILPIVSQFVGEGSTVFTDELNSYNLLTDMGYDHKICNHDSLQFVIDGETYTNNIYGFWSHFRRMISGCYHDVSDEHLQSYIDEAVYRWNTRKASQTERFENMFAKSIGLVVTWDGLNCAKRLEHSNQFFSRDRFRHHQCPS